jgi:hypothetical protein
VLRDSDDIAEATWPLLLIDTLVSTSSLAFEESSNSGWPHFDYWIRPSRLSLDGIAADHGKEMRILRTATTK